MKHKQLSRNFKPNMYSPTGLYHITIVKVEFLADLFDSRTLKAML